MKMFIVSVLLLVSMEARATDVSAWLLQLKPYGNRLEVDSDQRQAYLWLPGEHRENRRLVRVLCRGLPNGWQILFIDSDNFFPFASCTSRE